MCENYLLKLVREKYSEKSRLVAPLVGFPGINLVGSTIKLAQQNYKEHFKVLQAINNKLNPDVIFPLMDLSVEANALGCFTLFPKAESATVVKEESALSEIEKLKGIDITSDSRVLAYANTVELLRQNILPDKVIGAYVTGPYTLAALIMGAEEAAFATIIQPELLEKMCALTKDKILDYVRLLISSGAQLICILEPSAVMLSPEQFELYSVKYVKMITDFCREMKVTAVYHICGNTTHLISKMVATGVNVLSLDSPEMGVDLHKVVDEIPDDIIIMGNISPIGALLKGNPEDVRDEVNYLLKTMSPYPNFILSTGCYLPQEVPIENIFAFIDAGRKYKMN